jgi:hypothetical protein
MAKLFERNPDGPFSIDGPQHHVEGLSVDDNVWMRYGKRHDMAAEFQVHFFLLRRPILFGPQNVRDIVYRYIGHRIEFDTAYVILNLTVFRKYGDGGTAQGE